VRINISAIARESGVSRTTVNKILSNKRGPISESTLERVADAMTTLYAPVTADDLRVGLGVSSNPLLMSIRQQRRVRRCAQELSGFVNNLYDLLSHSG
jgi:transcriptional regulator with XRE-family HTH domain